MFNGFTIHDIERAGLRLPARRGGSGPPLLPLHGHRQTHAMWHRGALDLGSAAVNSVRGRTLDCGHDIAEEAPAALIGKAFDFFKE